MMQVVDLETPKTQFTKILPPFNSDSSMYSATSKKCLKNKVFDLLQERKENDFGK
jgi:hypothetical protein